VAPSKSSSKKVAKTKEAHVKNTFNDFSEDEDKPIFSDKKKEEKKEWSSTPKASDKENCDKKVNPWDA
jgi:hypothetical protein